ncbi:DUF1152 domain-containing protein [Streptomyces sp. RG38]|uniref:DUF1152 domain-containing protein n=1 Tax=Streptomyces tagetis TaxID=2820809 RepID=A0A940XHI6_9ACTN|nr:DUF1152 domain-containing protein [Streptomyces sp. RG38]
MPLPRRPPAPPLQGTAPPHHPAPPHRPPRHPAPPPKPPANPPFSPPHPHRERGRPTARPSRRPPQVRYPSLPLDPSVPADARPVAPAGSTLPRLAATLPHTLALLDPRHGAEDVTRRVEEPAEHLNSPWIDLLDVGGDILARGDEPTLGSPLADVLALAGCSRANAPVRLLIAGPGLDGEVPLDALRRLLGPLVHAFTERDTEALGGILDRHPSEATAMLAAAARGIRGTCEVRDAGLPGPLTRRPGQP